MKKTLAAAVFTTLNFLLTAVSLAYVHEIHPEGTEPLPDQFLDRITYQVRENDIQTCPSRHVLGHGPVSCS